MICKVRRTKTEWRSKLKDKSITWLLDQTSPWVRGHNGVEYDDVVAELVEEKKDQLRRPPPKPLPVWMDDSEQGHVEVIPYGGKGQVLRVVFPK